MEKMEFDKIHKAMVIVAHADDAEWYMGGTINKLAGMGKNVSIVVATDGRIGTHKRQELRQLVDTRIQEQRKAAKILGVKDVYFLSYPDLELDKHRDGLAMSLMYLALKIRPDTVFNFDIDHQHVAHVDWHPDHLIVAEVGFQVFKLDATLTAKTNGRLILNTPVQYFYDPRYPNVEVNVASEFGCKLEALDSFESQELNHRELFVVSDGRVHMEQFTRFPV